MKARKRLCYASAVVMVAATAATLSPGAAALPAADPVVVAAGDVACRPGRAPAPDECQQRATSDLVIDLQPQAVLALGDLQESAATLGEFREAYHPTWGRLFDKTYPVAGNHEYDTPGAEGYFDYFGDRAGPRGKGYYSFDLGAWHIIALNSTLCDEAFGGCGPGSDQEQWLRADLAANPATCTLAFWHAPRFSSGHYRGSSNDTEPLWQALYEARAELVLSGHAQHYERFARQDAKGNYDSRGMRQFIVGTGGQQVHPVDEPEPNSVGGNNTTLGVLKLTLHARSYDWQFVPLPKSGDYTDSGSAACR